MRQAAVLSLRVHAASVGCDACAALKSERGNNVRQKRI